MSTSLPAEQSGLTIVDIETTTEDDGNGGTRVVPVLDENKQPVVRSRVAVPLSVEALGPEAIDAHVAETIVAQVAAAKAAVSAATPMAPDSPASPPTPAEGSEV